MSLFVVTGRANAGKSGTLYQRLQESSAAGEQPTLLLPVAQDARRATEEFAEKGVLGVRIVPLDDWIEQLWALHGDGRRFVGEAARNALLSRTIEDCPLRELRESSVHPGFVGLVADVARRLTIVPESAGSPLDRELVMILSAYRRCLVERGLVEPAIAAMELGTLAPPAGGPIAVNRFTDLSPAQEGFLVGMARTNEVLVSLAWERGFAATEALEGLADRLLERADRTEPVASAFPAGELGVVESELYQPVKVHQATGAVTFAVASGDEAECALAARIALQAVGEGTAPERVAVVFRDAGRRASLLAAALSSVGLEADFDVAEEFETTPLGRAFLALVDSCADSEAMRGRLLAWLLSPYSGVDTDVAAAADAGWRSGRLSGSSLLDDAAEKLGPAGLAVSACRRLLGEPVTPGSADQWKELADRMLSSSAKVRELNSLDGARDAGAHRSLMRALSELVGLEDAGVTADDLVRALRRTTATTGLVERRGAIQVTDAHRIRGRRFDVVILGGLTADEFSAEKPEPLVATLLERLGAPSGVDEALGERMLFYTLVSRARRRLVLIRQATDAQGEAVRPSLFYEELVDLYRDPATEDHVEFPAGATVYRLGLANLPAAAPAFSAGRLEARERVAASGSAPRSVRRGISDSGVLAQLAETPEFSVTELETYLACPFKWFYERAVRPRELDRELDARELGSRVHRILKDFYSEWGDGGREPRVKSGTLGDALELLGEIEERTGRQARMRPIGLAEELALARASGWARGIIEDDVTFLPGFVPVAHELRFGTEVEVPATVGGVAVRGSIDRVERGSAGVIAVDYKSKSAVVGHGSFATYGLIQLPAYALVASQVLGEPVAGGVYRSLRSLAVRGFYLGGEVHIGGRGSTKDELTEDEVAEVLAQAERRVVEAAEGIRSGQVAPAPHKKQTCAMCAARVACGEAR